MWCAGWEFAVNSSGAPFGFGKKRRMAGKLFEMAEDGGGIGGENVAGEAADGDVGFQKFGMVLGDGFFVGGYDAIIAAGERAGPGFVGAKLFVVLENLPRQGERS